MVAAEPMGAFNRDPKDLSVTIGDRLVVNHLLEHDFLSDVQLQSLLDDLERVPLLEKARMVQLHPTPTTTLFFAVSSTRFAILLRTGRSWSLWGLCLWWLRPP